MEVFDIETIKAIPMNPRKKLGSYLYVKEIMDAYRDGDQEKISAHKKRNEENEIEYKEWMATYYPGEPLT